MTDGLTFGVDINNWTVWRKQMQSKFKLCTPVDTETGEIIYNEKMSSSLSDSNQDSKYQTVTHKGKFGEYNISVKEIIKKNRLPKYYLRCSGSIHNTACNGANYLPFYFSAQTNEINRLCADFKIDSKKTRISAIEFGVNIPAEFVPHIFLDRYFIIPANVRTRQYTLDRKKRRLGYECQLSHYMIKCYDKGLQFDLTDNLMRFEVKFKVMQKINKEFNIRYLYDLTCKKKMKPLLIVLLNAWNKIILFEPLNTGDNKLTKLQKKLIQSGGNPQYWIALNNESKRKLHYHRGVLRQLINRYGKGYHNKISFQIEDEWNKSLNG